MEDSLRISFREYLRCQVDAGASVEHRTGGTRTVRRPAHPLVIRHAHRLIGFEKHYVLERRSFLQRQFWIPDVRNIPVCFQVSPGLNS